MGRESRAQGQEEDWGRRGVKLEVLEFGFIFYFVRYIYDSLQADHRTTGVRLSPKAATSSNLTTFVTETRLRP